MKKRKKAEPEGVLSLNINGHALTGEKRNGRWTFTCPSWPAMAKLHEGATDTAAVLGEFMGRALAGAVTVRQLFTEALADPRPRPD